MKTKYLVGKRESKLLIFEIIAEMRVTWWCRF